MAIFKFLQNRKFMWFFPLGPSNTRPRTFYKTGITKHVALTDAPWCWQTLSIFQKSSQAQQLGSDLIPSLKSKTPAASD